MQIVVTELPIEDALGRAQARFQQADERLAQTVEASATGLPWALGGFALVCGGGLALAGLLPLVGQWGLAAGVAALVVGGACLGYGLPAWMRARREKGRRTREWQHALEMLRLREQQAAESPGMTVEVLDRVGEQHAALLAEWNRASAGAPRYVQ